VKLAPRGFTLLEVLVALAVLAVSAGALLHQAQQSTRLQQQIELKSVALALADSELALIASETGNWPPLGRRSRQLRSESMEWEIDAEVQTTPNADLRRVDVRVRPVTALSAGQSDAALLALTTYMGRN
jgi:general secretion pathway protein I